MVTMEDAIVCNLSNGAISNDQLERTLFSRSHHALTLNISQTATDTAMDTVKYLGVFINSRTNRVDPSAALRKFLGCFNNIMSVLGYGRDEMCRSGEEQSH